MCGRPEKSMCQTNSGRMTAGAGVQGVSLLEKRDRDVMRSGLHRHPRREAAVHLVAGRRRVVAGCSDLGIAAERRQVDPRTVDRNLELVRILETPHRAQVRSEQLHLELVLAVERQRRVDQDAADGAERESFDVLILRRVLSHAEHFAGRRGGRIAKGERADAFRSVQITLEEHRRHAEDIGVVVES